MITLVARVRIPLLPTLLVVGSVVAVSVVVLRQKAKKQEQPAAPTI